MSAPRRMVLVVEGTVYDQWTEGEVTRDLQDFAGSFSFTLREPASSVAALPFASPPPPAFRLRKGMAASVRIDGETVLVGHIETVDRSIDDSGAEISVSGRDKTGDLIDSAAAADGPAEFKSVTLEEAARRIAKPFGLDVRSEVPAGRPFDRYAIGLTETGLSAIEKGARQRRALVLSDGIGGIVITRTGGSRAPADLRLPGNVKSSSMSESDAEQYSETIVRGGSEKAGGRRLDRTAAQLGDDDPLPPAARVAGDGSATERERRGTVATGRARNEEMRRHRPRVHLAKSQADDASAQDEADWRMRSARAQAEELTHTVHGFRASGRLWCVNQLAYVSDAFQGIERDLLISRTSMRFAEGEGEVTELTLSSPEAFDDAPEAGRRRNHERKAGTPGKADGAKARGGAADTTAEAL